MASRHALAALALALALSLAFLSTFAVAAPLPADNPSPAVLFSRPALVAVAPPPTAAHHATNRDKPAMPPPPMKRLPDFQAKHPLVPALASADQVHVHPAVPRNAPPVGVLSARDILAPSHAPVVAAVPKRGGGGSLLWNALSARFQAPSQRQRAVRAAAARPGPTLMHAVDASDHAAAAACESPAASCETDAHAAHAPPPAPALDELLAEALKETTLVFTKPRVHVEL
ncbi:hypothetical protein GGF31_002516 [Allomyces arbusculus]|nr:hypothetical protein GGF31_002516 [Allomyces arbusculus]